MQNARSHGFDTNFNLTLQGKINTLDFVNEWVLLKKEPA